MHIEAKLAELGLMLPEPMKPPPGVAVPPTWIRVRGNIAYLSGQSARNPDGMGRCRVMSAFAKP